MRYQERIYIQNNNDAVRNKVLSFNMSSDMSIFEGPLFNVSGASKIDCTGITSSYVHSYKTYLPLTFVFTAILILLLIQHHLNIKFINSYQL
jgi:hypothetical protein